MNPNHDARGLFAESSGAAAKSSTALSKSQEALKPGASKQDHIAAHDAHRAAQKAQSNVAMSATASPTERSTAADAAARHGQAAEYHGSVTRK